MDIYLYNNQSDMNVMNKNIGEPTLVTGSLLTEQVDETAPSIEIAVNPSNYNYCYIPIFHRYYYIDPKVIITNDHYMVSLKSDPLMSFRAYLANCDAIISRNNGKGMRYMDDSRVTVDRREEVNLYKFPGSVYSGAQTFILETI